MKSGLSPVDRMNVDQLTAKLLSEYEKKVDDLIVVLLRPLARKIMMGYGEPKVSYYFSKSDRELFQFAKYKMQDMGYLV